MTVYLKYPCFRFGCDDAVSTFVFMDFETTGMIGGNNDNEYRLLESKLREPQDYSNTLTKLILESAFELLISTFYSYNTTEFSNFPWL